MACVYFFEAITDGALLASTGDAINYFYPNSILLNKSLKSGTLPLWNPYMFSGIPFAGSHATAVFYPPTLLLNLLFSPKLAFNINFIAHYALAGYLGFLYFRRLTGVSGIGMFGGIAFGFIGFLHVVPDHINILMASAWMPLMVMLTENLSRKNPRRSTLLLGVVIALQFLPGSSQTVVYTHMMLAFLVAHAAYRTRGVEGTKIIARYALAAIIGCLLSLPQLLATMETASLAWRNTPVPEFFFAYPLLLKTLPDLLSPWVDAGINYAFMGVLILFTALASITLNIRHSSIVRLWTIVAAVFFSACTGETDPAI